MATTEINYALDELERNASKEEKIGNKIYKLKPMTNAISLRMDRYITKAQLSYTEDNRQLIVNMSKNRKLVPKCISLMLLHSFFKVVLFHWIHWRYLHFMYDQEFLGKLLQGCMSRNDIGFFLSNLAYLQANSLMIEQAAKTNTTSILQKLKLGPEMQSLLNSTDKLPPIPSTDTGG